jgi:hypothetical protein
VDEYLQGEYIWLFDRDDESDVQTPLVTSYTVLPRSAYQSLLMPFATTPKVISFVWN